MGLNNYRMIPTALLETNAGQIPGLPRNPRMISGEMFGRLKRSIQDAPEMLEMRSLVAVRHGEALVVVCGNMRLEACRELGYTELPCFVLPEDTPAGKLREYAVKDNLPYGDTDWNLIATEWDTAELEEWGLDLPDSWGEGGPAGEGTEGYSRSIEAPTYEPCGTMPAVSELTDTGKRDELVAEIERTEGLPDDVRGFLLQAAQRHVVFNYKRIGDFYAHSPKGVQELMERSALVIIDFDKAIENGFVELVEELEAIRRETEGGDDE